MVVFVCILHYFIVILMQTYLKVLISKVFSQVHSVEFVSKSNVLNYLSCNIWTLCVYFINFSFANCENKCT